VNRAALASASTAEAMAGMTSNGTSSSIHRSPLSG
jgi:hypothetical protein